MGMFDYYEPLPELVCPRCGQVLSGWQGGDSECALLVWRQGEKHPLAQQVPAECRLTDEDLKRFVLPEEFSICTHCTCSSRFLIEAIGQACEGLWIQTDLIQPADIEKRYAHLPRAQRQAMRQWLSEKVQPT